MRTITVNGEARAAPGGGTVAALLTEMGVPVDRRGVAVAVNGEIVSRERWSSARLDEGDRVDLVRPVQGG